MLADMLVQLFAAVMIIGMLMLAVVVFMNRRHDEEIEREYDDPEGFRALLKDSMGNQWIRLRSSVRSTISSTVQTLQTKRQTPKRAPSAPRSTRAHAAGSRTTAARPQLRANAPVTGASGEARPKRPARSSQTMAPQTRTAQTRAPQIRAMPTKLPQPTKLPPRHGPAGTRL